MRQDEDSVRVVRDVLGAEIVGAYLYGSAVQGGLGPHSDVDVLVVARRRTAPRQRRALVDGLLSVSGAYPRRGAARPIELTLVVESDVRPWRYPPRCEFQYGEWLRDELVRGDTPTPTRDPDLALLLTMVRQHSSPLVGPLPEDVLDPVPWQDLERALVAGVPDLRAELASDTRNVVLTLARIWTTLTTGTISSKEAAADWALGRLPAEHRPVLDRARAVHRGEQEEHWQDLLADVRPCVDHITRVIERMTGGDRSAGRAPGDH
ncbi:streptomycin 3'-adenylyltransferase [Saccharopolyspora lacisalsi]|uniref:Streptomycin 3'-adenylyltransferase n=1 Tax=Halosaccharopolyspora lacisalsi TaxID=1000566 RepID=A0A839DZK0_9PSEU|nr:aminoglycoside adenylyltransferase family protein [Halosaccharopolyspora lacisalsi]MBA8824651.1 streptomycin 3'-adenylyltransferase [Halosaccharopolyspora lacisalsi]